MGKPHHQPLGLEGVRWQVVKCEILERDAGGQEGDRIGTLERAGETTWRYSCGETEGTVEAEFFGLLEYVLEEPLERKVSVRPVHWRCHAHSGYTATVALHTDGTALACSEHWRADYPTAYAAFRDVERRALRFRACALDAELERALDALAGVLWQACGQGVLLDTYALSAYAQGARVLAYYGRLVIDDEYGRRVLARMPEQGEGDSDGE